MADRSRPKDKPKAKAKPEQKPTETVHLTPEELRAISGGMSVNPPPPQPWKPAGISGTGPGVGKG
jgi:hypothetical protein